MSIICISDDNETKLPERHTVYRESNFLTMMNQKVNGNCQRGIPFALTEIS